MRECISIRANPLTDPPVSAAIPPGPSRASTPDSERSSPCCAEMQGNIRPDERATDGSLRCRSRLPPPAFGSISDHATADRCGRHALASFRLRVPRIRGAAGSRRRPQMVKFPPPGKYRVNAAYSLACYANASSSRLAGRAREGPQRDETAATGRRPNSTGILPGSSGKI